MNTTQTQVRSTEEALKMALEMLKDNQHLVADNERHAYVMAYNRVIKRCEEALAQPEQEPVAWLDVEGNGIPVPVYTTPPQRTWVGLTDEEMRLIDPDGFEDNLPQMIQQALKEKNERLEKNT